MYNPFSEFGISGTWLDHVGVPVYPAKGSTGYSAGGLDAPCGYGTELYAPAAGTLRTSGGSGEFEAGWVGSAGRRSVFDLDDPVSDLVAIVLQHQSKFGTEKHYEQRELFGWSGASANGKDRGGDIHLHHHGLTASGRRVDWTRYISASASSGFTPITSTPKGEDTMLVVHVASEHMYTIGQHFVKHEVNEAAAQFSCNLFTVDDKIIPLTHSEFDAVCDSLGIPRTEPIRLATQDRGGVWAPSLEIINVLNRR